MRQVVIVFARAPRLGTVKRRLAAGIGARSALQFYRAILFRLLRSLARDRRFRLVVALTPDHATVRWPVRVATIGQGAGTLGRRMKRAFTCFATSHVVLIGSDIPDAKTSDVVDAFAKLRASDAVFGPARDGGYWLVGLSRRRPASPFSGVRWSTEHALADTLQNFTRQRVTWGRTLHDIDTAADMATWRLQRKTW